MPTEASDCSCVWEHSEVDKQIIRDSKNGSKLVAISEPERARLHDPCSVSSRRTLNERLHREHTCERSGVAHNCDSQFNDGDDRVQVQVVAARSDPG
jgi:hypothetical protein